MSCSAPIIQTDFVKHFTRLTGNTTVSDEDKQLFLVDGFYLLSAWDEDIVAGLGVDSACRIIQVNDPPKEPQGIQRLSIIAMASVELMRRLLSAINNFEYISWSVKDAEKSVSLNRGQDVRMGIVEEAKQRLKEILQTFSDNALLKHSKSPMAFGTLDPEIFFQQTFFNAFRNYFTYRQPEDII